MRAVVTDRFDKSNYLFTFIVINDVDTAKQI
jgi:hypothetical protein